jgi:hypothetical protein
MLIDAGVPARLNPHSITVWFLRPNDDFGYSLVFEDDDAHISAMPQVSEDLLEAVANKYIAWWNSQSVTSSRFVPETQQSE